MNYAKKNGTKYGSTAATVPRSNVLPETDLAGHEAEFDRVGDRDLFAPLPALVLLELHLQLGRLDGVAGMERKQRWLTAFVAHDRNNEIRLVSVLEVAR